MSIKSFFKSHGKQITILVAITIIILISLKYEIDTKIVVFGTVILGVFTQAFAGVAALIATLPVIYRNILLYTFQCLYINFEFKF